VSLYLYVSIYCFLTCLGYIILGARRGDFSYGLGVFDFSYDKVKRAGSRLLRGFLSP